ncbi:GcrA cell cycle regulator [Caulobacter ginsengisoli]|uniref:GcrA cell cycle regulator n=1 Tax=Caulobacter ginsengisoli TaxID=400775 RepID=A0ABU0IKS2_9CAUL|nr:GcrA family cell cycle regulator [Caulobacter ginsengisoli]MDQ0462611.1 GcrA cell cycle regulator [Caulobacter ginsengisoli]
MSEWSQERVEALKRGFAAGLSFARIAREIGGGVTRNACIGKATRMGLERSRDKAAFHQLASKVGTANHKAVEAGRERLKAPPVARATAQNNGFNFRGAHVQPAGLRALAAFDERAFEGLQGGVAMAEVERHHCRWPFGDPERRDFRFCGARKARGSYCSAHAAIAFPVPPEQILAEAQALERLFGRVS